MSYIAFARKYRPQVFDDITGQPHITTTLKNAISQGRVAHAYIFAGPRGVGKTTTARILAKSLNCDKGPSPKPCNACPACKDITNGRSMDVLEIDGASNRGIDEIRNLRENVKFSPSRGAFRIYIIDEVHMLTAEAFNALLKTLEEPPPHVKFIFATTQAHKVPATILSRCQRFDFRRIAAKDILANLKVIAKGEGLKASDEALMLLAKYSDGALRDAQVIFDQLASFSKERIEAQDVARMLGVVEDDIIFSLAGFIKEKNISEALKTIDSLMASGADALQVVLKLIEHFRDLAIAKSSDSPERLIEASDEKIKYYKAESAKYTIEEILYVIYTLSGTIDFIRKSNLARIPLEAAVIKLARTSSMMPLDEIVRRIAALESGHRTEFEPAPPPPKSEQAPRENPAPSAAGQVPHEKADADPSKSTDLDEVLSAWTGVINYLKPKKMSVASYLQEGYPSSVEGRIISVAFPKELQFHKEVLESKENRRLIEEAVERVLNLKMRVVFTLTEDVGVKRSAPTGAGGEEPEENAGSDISEEGSVKKEVDPIVKTAMDILGGDIAGEAMRKKGAR